jgi:NAD(P)-dependent dehydrogenase (short-subunit alcohol dehydrogenase family)
MNRFTNKIILVTGAARGIGLATARRFASEGATVIATDIEKEILDESVGDLVDEGLRVEMFAHDVTSRDAWQEVVNGILNRHGRLDVLVNNAGTGEFANIEETTIEQWRRVMAVNLEGVFHGMQAGIAAMKETGGVIINMASIAANIGEPLLPAYGATKGGVSMLTKSAAVDCARRGYNIRINSIHPGYTDTKLVSDAIASLGPAGAEVAEGVAKAIPLGRLAEPDEIAGPILFLASDDATYMIGSELVVDGGYISA